MTRDLYGSSIAVTIRSLNRSLFARLIVIPYIHTHHTYALFSTSLSLSMNQASRNADLYRISIALTTRSLDPYNLNCVSSKKI